MTDMELQQYIKKQLQGSPVIDTAIEQLFGKRPPIDIRLAEVGYLLHTHCGISKFDSIFEPRSLSYKCRVLYEGNNYYIEITDETLRCAPIEYIVNEIVKSVALNLVSDDPEYQFENENEQAFLDAAHDYGFV